MTSDTDETADAIVTRVATAFEEAWRQWGPPTIKFYLRGVRPDCRPAALMELVRIDLEHRFRLGERPSPVRYVEQFPRIFGLGMPDRQQLNDVIRQLAVAGPPPPPAAPTQHEILPKVAPATTQVALEVEPSDWIESLGSFTRSGDAASAVATLDAEAESIPYSTPTRARPRRGGSFVLILTLVALVFACSIYFGMSGDQKRTKGSVAVPAPAPAPSTQQIPPMSKPQSPPRPRVVDLLPLIDVHTNAAGGAWTRSADGALDSDASVWAMLRIPYRPPAEYDLEAEFERLPGGAGGASTGLVGSARGTSFEWNVWLDPESCGFWLIDQKPWREGPTDARGTVAFNAGGRHTARLSVRRDGVEGYLDGVRVAGWKTDFHDLSLPHAEQWDGPVSLGLRTYENPTRFFSVKLTEREVR